VRTIAVVTVARSDYGIYRPVLERLRADASVRLELLVSGAHLSPAFGHTVDAIVRDGYPVAERIETLLSSDTAGSISRAMGLGLLGFAQAFERRRPDLLVLLGDRFDMYSAALAALPFRIPVAHIHGGELTAGAIDDALRHSLTKLSHLHFVATKEYARRVRQLGEAEWRIEVCGAPGLDNVLAVPPEPEASIAARFGIRLSPAPLLVTFHPVTLEADQNTRYVEELLAALDEVGLPIVFTMPNADTGRHLIEAAIRGFVEGRANRWAVENLDTGAYFGLMARAVAMVGNSSSGLIEAPSFGLPVVNIGTRQAGRIRAANVIDTGYSRGEIAAAIRAAAAPDFRQRLVGQPNPYGDGQAAARIAARLCSIPLDDRLLMKSFEDWPLVP
jgi:UDP-hydrolysing UDP-N-acetyl-D-glucosamine 2-epimerase